MVHRNRLFIALATAAVCSGCATKPPSPGEYWKVTTKFTYDTHASRGAAMKVCQPVNKNGLKDRLTMAFGQMHKSNREDGSGCEPAILKTTGNKTEWKLECTANNNGMAMMNMNMYGTIVGTDKKFTITTHNDAKVTSMFYSAKNNNGFQMGGQSSEWEYLGGSCDTNKDKPVRIRE